MSLYDINQYTDDINAISKASLPWDKFQDSSIMISGATGMIGSLLVDVLCYKNENDNLNCTIYLLSRSEDKVRERFGRYINDPHFVYINYEVKRKLVLDDIGKVDYILHLASNSHPLQYSTDPIGTITTNIIGLQNLLEFAVEHKTKRFAFASSNEIYGENRGDVEFFDEDYCGYINSNTMRAGYPESKRCGGALCQAYIAQKGIDVVIPRLTRSYGPTMLMSDTKAICQFIKKGIAGENIVLKSAGNQYYSYQYAADSVLGVLFVLLCGKCGEAYNIASESSDIMLKDLAKQIADINGTNVIFEMPDQVESAGYSTTTKARLNGRKLQELGWIPQYDITAGLLRTIEILKELKKEN